MPAFPWGVNVPPTPAAALALTPHPHPHPRCTAETEASYFQCTAGEGQERPLSLSLE